MTEHDTPDPNGLPALRVPFIFVKHGDPEPTAWLRAHPAAVRIPATLVPRGPEPVGPAPSPAGTSTVPGSFAPLRQWASWPIDSKGRPWPKNRFGNPQRPFYDYRADERAPGEPIPPAEQAVRDFDMLSFDPIGAAVKMMRVTDDPARAAGIVVGPRPAGQSGPIIKAQAAEGEEPDPREEQEREEVERGLDYEAGRAASRNPPIWSSIQPTQPVYPGTEIPRSFILATGNDRQRIWVNPSATKHLQEYTEGMLGRGVSNEMVDLFTQVNLTSLQQAVRAATARGIPYGQTIREEGWELAFSPPRQPGQLPVLIHAVPLRRGP